MKRDRCRWRVSWAARKVKCTMPPKKFSMPKAPRCNRVRCHLGKPALRGKSTANILLEGAAWNFINIRKTAKQHNLPSEASFRFSRGVHPAMAEQGVRRGLQLMAEWSGGKVAPGLVDEYPLKPDDPTVTVTPKDVKRLIGIDLTAQEIADLLTHLEFECIVEDDSVHAKTPPHRLDIGEGIVGVADVVEEVARSYGFDRIPETRMADALPPQIGNPVYEWEERVRDILVTLGLQEVVTYRLTSPERESRLVSQDEYVELANPIAPERRVMRRSLLASVLEVAEKNSAHRDGHNVRDRPHLRAGEERFPRRTSPTGCGDDRTPHPNCLGCEGLSRPGLLRHERAHRAPFERAPLQKRLLRCH